MNNGSGDTAFGMDDAAIIAMTVGIIVFVFHQFRIGEASGKGDWIKRSEQPRRFAIMMGCYVIIAAVFVLVSAGDIYARIATCRDRAEWVGHTAI